MVKDKMTGIVKYIVPVLLWVAVAVLIGICGGLLGTAFYKSIEAVTKLRSENSWIIGLLPVGGIAIVLMYHSCRVKMSVGTNIIIDTIRTEKEPPLRLIPLIFTGSVITHLLGGSAGREGAALQLGGVVGDNVGKLFGLGEKDLSLAVLCGMSAVFSSLFGTPLTATVFAMEVASVGVIYYAALLPCITSSVVAYLISRLMGAVPERFDISILPENSILSGVRVVVLAALCAGLSIVFCIIMHETSKLLSKIFKNEYLRIFTCGLVIIGLTFLVGNQDYNGAGMNIVALAINGTAKPEAFIIKIVFTAITIGAGYKGGEIVPTFFIGATFGCVMGGLLGLPAGFGAAVGLCAMFCGAVNCPMASIFLAIELFNASSIPFFFIAICVSYALSGYYGLYSSQKIMYSKYKLEFINRMAK